MDKKRSTIKLPGFFLHYSEEPIPGDSFQIHWHEDYEIFFFLEGDADYMVEGNQYHLTPHSVLLLSPHVFHGVRVNRTDLPYKRIVININPAFVSVERRHILFSMFPGNLFIQSLKSDGAMAWYSTAIQNDKASNFTSSKTARNIPEKEVYYEHSDLFHIDVCFDAIMNCHMNQKPASKELLTIYVEALLAQLTLMSQTLSPIPHDDSVSERLSEIIQYLNEHLSDDISLDTLEKRFFINRHYLNRVFRKATGTTVMNYLQYKRIMVARELLLNGSSAQEVSSQVGFTEYSTFYRAYCRILGHTPKADRSEPAHSGTRL